MKPGSLEAQFYGCTCPKAGNRYGRGAAKPRASSTFVSNNFYITGSCPVHSEWVSSVIDKADERNRQDAP